MNNESWNEKITDLIIKLETQINVNNKFGCMYDNLVNVIVNETEKYITLNAYQSSKRKKM